ncbi:hypothetical protein ACEQ8H_003538 [Pleosporales sp. CAS-2024a]
MVRSHGKFSFPLPGRNAQKKNNNNDDDAASMRSTPSMHEWPLRIEEPSGKALRILGTSDPMYRPTSKHSVAASPGYISVTVSEPSHGSQHRDKPPPVDHDGYLATPVISRRVSSNVVGRAYSGDDRRGSGHSTASNRLRPQTSNSTLRSHYDAKSSPLSISQQTSDSAVRDMALTRGKPHVVPDFNSNGYIVSPVSPVIQEEARRKEQRKRKPTRLDLSKLFPKSKAGEAPAPPRALLSPAKMVNSPAALSISSEFQFPRPMSREPTPSPNGQNKPKKLQRKAPPVPPTPSSPVRKYERDEYDNAKVHVRRPPKGVQHWFDAVDDDSDDMQEAVAPVHDPTALPPYGSRDVPTHKASLDRLISHGSAQQGSHSIYVSRPAGSDTFSHEDLVDVARLTSPSQYTLLSTITTESALSKAYRQDSSVLSCSSSDDEGDNNRTRRRMVPVRKSIDVNDDSDDFVIGQAQAFELQPQRRPSAPLSIWSTTSAATIEVMYTPEPPFTPLHYPITSSYSGSRRPSHVRQPSVIHEDEDYRPRTAVSKPRSTPPQSIRSARTATSEPKPRSDGTQKFMAVTAEEEALLELMRKKRAAMGMTQASHANPAMEEQDQGDSPPTVEPRKSYRTSGFLAEASPVRVREHKATKRAPTSVPSQLQPLPRGRPLKARYDASLGPSQLRDSSTSDAWSDHQGSPASQVTLPPYLPLPSLFSPLDLFPQCSPVLTASVASPTTTEHASPLPSPVTPGLRAYEEEVDVKVANSDTSNDVDEPSLLDTGVLDAIAKSRSPSRDDSTHRRRRTASSGADVSFPVPPTHGLADLAPLSAGSPRAPSIIEPPMPRLPAKGSKRISGLTLIADSHSRNRQSVNSNHSQASSHSYASSHMHTTEKRLVRQITHKSSAGTLSVTSNPRSKRNSVSDDVLAAWNSLGGTY